MILVKSHGLGNDYLVLAAWGPGQPAPTPGRALDAGLVRRLCDRHRGPGADGVLEPVWAGDGAWGLRIWNPDGSQAEKSGNGLRIYARFLVDHRGAPPSLEIVLPGGPVACTVRPGAVRVAMGLPAFAPERIPATRGLLDTAMALDGRALRLSAVGLGNPHCVALFDEDLDGLPWRRWGALLERFPLFPQRTNVQFARVLARDRIEARVWERGAGATLASGSSACAVAAVAGRLGLTDATVTVAMPGGDLTVHADPDGALHLEGPAEEIAEIRLSPAWLAAPPAEPAAGSGGVAAKANHP